MKTLRRVHLYLGCFFAPLLIYFALSGAWQSFRLNDLPKDTAAPVYRTIFHELSKPHRDSTLPGRETRTAHSDAFATLAAAMGIGIALTSVLGIILALRGSRKPAIALISLAAGVVIPILFLLTSS